MFFKNLDINYSVLNWFFEKLQLKKIQLNMLQLSCMLCITKAQT